MMRRTTILSTVLCVLAFGLSGVAGCPTTDNGDPDYTPPAPTVDDLLIGLDVADSANAWLAFEAARAGDFDACMVSAGIASGIAAARLYAPEIDAEVTAPDGVINFPGYLFDGTDCDPYKPTPWPPLEANPQIGTIVGPMAESTLGLASSIVLLNAPAEGEPCLRAHLAAAILAAVGTQTGDVIDEALIDADLLLPVAPFSVDYSGCGI